MTIDFTEIPKANQGGGEQDHFELFSRDFLIAMGYKIIRHPDRGADGKKDMIVSETRNGISGETTIKWLVSCKHHAHSKKSVNDTDEANINDRVNAHQCDGFIGVYSTLPSSGLSNNLFGNKDKIPYIIYDCGQIESHILSNKQNEQLLMRYFPKSYSVYCQQISLYPINQNEEKNITTTLTEEDLLRIQKTAIITIEIEKIKEEYWKADWYKRNEIIGQLNKYAAHSNTRLAREVFHFLYEIATLTRAEMTYDSACSVYTKVLTFFPGFYNEDDKESIVQIAKQSIHIGHNIAYDACIHLRNLAVAMWGLTIIKFIYRTSKDNNIVELKDIVIRTYNELESTLKRPERNDLSDAQELVKIFRSDLDVWDLAFPILTPHLTKRISEDEGKSNYSGIDVW